MTGKKKYIALVLLVKSVFLPVFAQSENETIDVVDALQSCRGVIEPDQRLKCFDGLAKRFAPPDYSGKHNMVTEVFTLDKPHQLRYRSYGVIFVLYLRDAEGNVIQNLHLGGTGEEIFIIDSPGQYSLKIDGSERWAIWLEPLTSTGDVQDLTVE